MKVFESFWKMENHFSLSLSCRPTHLFLFLFHPAAQKLFPAGPFPASWPSPAQRPSPLPVSPPGGPRPSGSSPSPDRAGLKLESDPAARAAAPLLARTPRARVRPYISAPRPPWNPKPEAAAAAFTKPSSHCHCCARARSPPRRRSSDAFPSTSSLLGVSH